MRYVYLAAVGLLSIVLTVNLLSPGRPGARGAPPPQAPDASAEKAVEKTPPVQAPDKDPRVCTHCICGCTETGKCDCKDCDHPKLAPAGKTSGKGLSLSYAAGYRAAVDQGKPLVVWIGGMRCPPCESGCSDLLHCYTDSLGGDDSARCVVSRPDGAGGLDRCGTLTVTSCEGIRGLLARRTTATASGCPAGACGVAGQCGVGGCQAGSSCGTCGAGMGYGGPPVFFGGGPMMGGGGCGAGGCSSCGGGGRRR